MTWDPTWENVFQLRKNWGEYPPEDFVRFFAKEFPNYREIQNFKILEIGCGPGAGVAFFARNQEIQYVGIDASETAINQARQKFSDAQSFMRFEVVQVDDTNLPSESFDLIIDIACLQHNSDDGVERILKEIHRLLKPGGQIYSQQVSENTDHDKHQKKIDARTFVSQSTGFFKNLGVTRFINLASVVEDFRDYSNLRIDIDSRTRDNRTARIESLIIKASKAHD